MVRPGPYRYVFHIIATVSITATVKLPVYFLHSDLTCG